jgi:hypothetical protein
MEKSVRHVSTVAERAADLQRDRQVREYNYEHFRTGHFVADLRRLLRGMGVRPGQEAPDFELESTKGERVRLSALRGRPVVLRFASFTWPIAAGAVAPIKELHDLYGDRVDFVDILIRQEHPGERRGPYRTYEEKLQSAREHEREEGIGWTVLVDDLAGTVHKAYGGAAAPVYLIDVSGRVAFYSVLAHAPTLKRAIDELLANGGHGIISGDVDRWPHVFASLVDGWRGSRRGGLRAVLDYELAVPGAATLTFLGHLAKPVLSPLALRSTPLPVSARLTLGSGLIATTALGAWLLRRRG